MKNEVKLGVIGLGLRGSSMLNGVILPMREQGLTVAAVCDRLEDRALDHAHRHRGQRIHFGPSP